MAWLRAALVLASLLALSCGSKDQPKSPAKKAVPTPDARPGGPAPPLACVYRFYDVTDNAEASRLRAAIQALAKDGRVTESTTGDPTGQYREYQFTLASLDQVAKLDGSIRAKAAEAGDQAPSALLYEQIDARLSASYRTVSMTATLESVVRFKVTPGATLFYSLGVGQEAAVPREQIDSAGKVALALHIPRGQRFLYARTELSGVKRFLRINCETGQIEDVDAAAYEKWRTSGNP